MSDCIFCKIIDGDIPCAKVYEDEHVLAFLDISQVTKGHTLVIPKIHKENIYDMTPEVSNHYFQAIPKIARAIKQEFEPIGLNLLNNNGEKVDNLCSITICILFRVMAKATALVPYGNHTKINIHQRI